MMFTASGPQEMLEPRALSTGEVAETVQDYRRAAAAAIAAGADGVEIHGANGYLVHQFLASNANQRTDRYGGSIENRIRFAVEVASAVADEIGAGRTGIRISPGNPFNDIVEHDVAEIYGALVPALGRLELAYLHLTHGADEDLAWAIRRDWPSALLLNRPGADIRVRAQDVWLTQDDFVNHFGGDVEPVKAQVVYAVQQPLAASAFNDVMTVPAWKVLPSWYLVTQVVRLTETAAEAALAAAAFH
jgi:hypothetical protein